MAFFVLLAVTVALAAVNYLLMPKPKSPRPEAVKDLENPTAEAGRPVPVPFGTLTIKGLNALHYTDKGKRTYKTDA